MVAIAALNTITKFYLIRRWIKIVFDAVMQQSNTIYILDQLSETARTELPLYAIP